MIGFRNVEFRGFGRDHAVTGDLPPLEFQFIELSQRVQKGALGKSGTSEAKVLSPSIHPCQEIVVQSNSDDFHGYDAILLSYYAHHYTRRTPRPCP